MLSSFCYSRRRGGGRKRVTELCSVEIVWFRSMFVSTTDGITIANTDQSWVFVSNVSLVNRRNESHEDWDTGQCAFDTVQFILSFFPFQSPNQPSLFCSPFFRSCQPRRINLHLILIFSLLIFFRIYICPLPDDSRCEQTHNLDTINKHWSCIDWNCCCCTPGWSSIESPSLLRVLTKRLVLKHKSSIWSFPICLTSTLSLSMFYQSSLFRTKWTINFFLVRDLDSLSRSVSTHILVESFFLLDSPSFSILCCSSLLFGVLTLGSQIYWTKINVVSVLHPNSFVHRMPRDTLSTLSIFFFSSSFKHDFLLFFVIFFFSNNSLLTDRNYLSLLFLVHRIKLVIHFSSNSVHDSPVHSHPLRSQLSAIPSS